MPDVVRPLIVALAVCANALAADDSCNLTSSQKMKAVKAFKALSPIFYDQRCINCHGAVNPFAPNGDHPEVIDMKKATQDFVNLPDASSRIVARNDDLKEAGLRSLREFANGNGPFTDKDVIRIHAFEPMRLECARCHVDDWLIPMSTNDFTGRSWKQICRHLKTSKLTSPVEFFLRHMQEDPQVLLGFEGKRGLLSPVGVEPPAMSPAAVAKHANDWVEAMDGRFHPPAECGCEVEGLALEIRHRIHTNPDSSSSKMGRTQFDGTVAFNVLLEEVAEGRYYNDTLVVRRELDVKHTKPSFWKCAGTGWRDELWQISADLDEEKKSMQAKGHVLTDTVYVDVHSFLGDLTLSTDDGAVARKDGQLPAGQADTRFVKQFESITVSLIDRP